MFRDVVQRSRELPLQSNRNGPLWSSPGLNQLDALLDDLGGVDDVHHSNPLIVRLVLSISPALPLAELGRKRNVLLRDHATGKARTKHASHEYVEGRRGKMDG